MKKTLAIVAILCSVISTGFAAPQNTMNVKIANFADKPLYVFYHYCVGPGDNPPSSCSESEEVVIAPNTSFSVKPLVKEEQESFVQVIKAMSQDGQLHSSFGAGGCQTDYADSPATNKILSLFRVPGTDIISCSAST